MIKTIKMTPVDTEKLVEETLQDLFWSFRKQAFFIAAQDARGTVPPSVHTIALAQTGYIE